MCLIKTFVLLIIGLGLILGENQNNVCNTIEAYFNNIDKNPNCWYDSDVTATTEQLAANHGLTLEKYEIKTTDGYILTTFRLKIIGGLHGKEVIFLQHGLGSDAECFMMNGNNSIAFFLASEGFDVWMGNFRGSEFSRHEFLSRDSSKFWDFSFHEHGLYDLSANFKYIGSKTKRKIIYIGHSMGGTSMGIYASMKSKEAETYVKHAILLAPSFYMRTTKGLTTFNNVNNVYRFLTYAAAMFNVLLETNSFERQAIQKLSLSSLEDLQMVLDIITISSGQLPISTAWERLPRSLKEAKNAGFKDVLHYAQMILTGEFRMFDYGSMTNMIRYNTLKPPTYELSNIIIDVSLIYFNDDPLATPTDVIYTFKKYGKKNWDLHGWPGSHLSFLIENNVDKTFYPFMLKLINKNIL